MSNATNVDMWTKNATLGQTEIVHINTNNVATICIHAANDINSMKLFIIAHNCNNTTDAKMNVANSECERLSTCEHKFDTPGLTIS